MSIIYFFAFIAVMAFIGIVWGSIKLHQMKSMGDMEV